jgi:hypothetical protein
MLVCAEWCLGSKEARPAAAPRLPGSVRYVLSDTPRGIAVAYEDAAGQQHQACFEAHRLCYSEDVDGSPCALVGESLEGSDLARPGQIMLPCGDTFEVPDAWWDLATWSTSDTRASYSAGLLIVNSTSTVRNAMHAALALAAAGGILDALEFDRLPRRLPEGKPGARP